MILERIVGRDVSKPISSKAFHDVHYLRQMLFCVFSSLHQAQRKLAFHHADLRLPNIMEVIPEAQHDKISCNDSSNDGTIQDAQYESQKGNLATPGNAKMQTLSGTQSGTAGLISSNVDHSQLSGKTLSHDLAGFESLESRGAHFKVSNPAVQWICSHSTFHWSTGLHISRKAV